MRDDGRTQAWEDTLDEDELAVATRVQRMPWNMAVAFLAVEMHRHERSNGERMNGRAPWWQQFAGAAAALRWWSAL